MIHVLHLIETVGPGGAETVFEQLAVGLDRERFRSTIVVPGPGWLYDRLRSVGASPVIVPAGGRLDLAFVAGLVRLALRERVDVIQAHLFGAATYAAAAGLLARVPVVATLHGTVDVARGERLLAVKRSLLRAGASRVVFVSESLRKALAGPLGLDRDQSTVIYNGVQVERFARRGDGTLRRSLGLPPETRLVGAIGNFRSAKDYPGLLRAFGAIASQDPLSHLVIAGDPNGADFDVAAAVRAQLGLSNRVHFLGYRDDPENVLAELDLFVLASTTEGFSIATIEAMAAGVPVVATRSGGPEEIVCNERDGLLVPVSDPRALAEAILRLLADDALRARFREAAARTVASRFTGSAMLDAYASLYANIVRR